MLIVLTDVVSRTDWIKACEFGHHDNITDEHLLLSNILTF